MYNLRRCKNFWGAVPNALGGGGCKAFLLSFPPRKSVPGLFISKLWKIKLLMIWTRFLKKYFQVYKQAEHWEVQIYALNFTLLTHG
jgi:hypothetical protein